MLQKLEVFALRGATAQFALDFEKGKKITIIYGENATGKSTICDAFELLANGKVGSLEGKGLGKTEPYWHSTGNSPANLRVKLTSAKGQWEAKVSKGKVVVTPESNRPQAEVLRRSQILTLIAEQPKNRYDAVRPFIEIDGVEQSEASLRKLIETERANQKIAIARIAENQVAIESFWKVAGGRGSNALAWARKEVARDQAELDASLQQAKVLERLLLALVTEQENLSRSYAAAKQSEEAINLAKLAVEQELNKIPEDAASQVGILEAAKVYFHDHPSPGACPLCGSAEFASGLSVTVESKLESIKALIQALKLRAEAQRKADFVQKQVVLGEETLLGAADGLVSAIKSKEQPTALDLPMLLIDAATALDAASAQREERLPLAQDLSSHARAASGEVHAFIEKLQENKGILLNLVRAVEIFDTNFLAQKELDVLLPRLEAALQEIEHERRAFVDAILTAIAKRVGDLYEEIHPKEGLSKISLLLDPDKRASLEIEAPFPGAPAAPPGAYFSDSHLDTLGLCIFLALAERGGPKDRILVLDDVVASADEPHVDRVIDVLYQVAQQYQHCILTTHYRPWREKYRWGWLRNGQCQFIELLTWEHKSGLKHGNHIPPLEELRDLLTKDQPSAQLTCASAGVILEGILTFLVHLYECSIPCRKGNPTLGDLLPNVKGKLRGALKVDRKQVSAEGVETFLEQPLQPMLDQLSGIASARNVFGCHFNELSQHLPEADALLFARTVLDLGDCLIDVNSGWPGSDKSGSYWSNSDGTRRLHPLRQPN